MKINKLKIFLIGLGFFTVAISWSIYNAFVPIFLDRIINSSMLVGFIMSVDNIFGVIFQPYFGGLSDRTNNKFGRRMPFLIIGIPIAAIFFALIPLHINLFTLMLSVMGMNFFMSVYRAPTVALMPDSTPTEHRSKANGIINFMGGLGTAVALYIGGKLFDQSENSPFFLTSVLMIFALVLLVVFFKEPKKPYSHEDSDVAENSDESLLKKSDSSLFISKNNNPSLISQNPSLLFMLIAIFFWFVGYNALETFFTLYCKDALGITPGQASQMMVLMAGSFLVSAIPAGYIGTKFGRKVTMMFGLITMTISAFIIFLVPMVSVIKILLIVCGFSWSLIVINSYPSVVEMAPSGKTGAYTGYYYAFSFSASIASPILCGLLADILGSYSFVFLYGAIALAIATVCLVPVKKGQIK